MLLGTQMVAKGLNLDGVTLVGVLDADLSLYVDSYRASETRSICSPRWWAGPAGASARGRALIQTMTPEHRVIALAARQDYDGFYNLEVGLREARAVRPFWIYIPLRFPVRMRRRCSGAPSCSGTACWPVCRPGLMGRCPVRFWDRRRRLW